MDKSLICGIIGYTNGLSGVLEVHLGVYWHVALDGSYATA